MCSAIGSAILLVVVAVNVVVDAVDDDLSVVVAEVVDDVFAVVVWRMMGSRGLGCLDLLAAVSGL